MEAQQKSTNDSKNTEVTTSQKELPQFREEDVTEVHRLYIDFVSVGGLITDDDGTMTVMSTQDFANKIGVERTTLYTWRKKIPNFWEKVRERRMKIGSQARTNKVWNGVYLRAAKGDAEQAKIWLSTFDDWRPPAQAHEVKVNHGLADLIAAKQLQDSQNRKVIDADTAASPGSDA